MELLDSEKQFLENLYFLDVETGMKYCCNDVSFYHEMVRLYVEEEKKEVLDAFLQKEDWENYRICIHALKSTSLSIGAVRLSNNAKALEAAVKEEKYEHVKSQHRMLMEEYGQLIEKLKKAKEIYYSASENIEEPSFAREADWVIKRECTDGSNLCDQLLKALVSVVDEKDLFTRGHSSRVAKYAVEIAKELNYGKKDLEQVYYAGLLHDIGKINIPREIIEKSGKLTADEFEIVKTHTIIGNRIVGEITDMPNLSKAVRWHHEHFDGTGYPDHLRDVEIPEIARILAVADSFDAMISKRRFRDALSKEEALQELENGKGTQFDPNVVDIMVQLIQSNETTS